MGETADQIARQRALLQSWVQSPEARNLASILIRRRNLDQDPDDLIGEAWLKITRTFTDRIDALPAMTSVQEAGRYGARVIDNLCRDLARKNFRRRETSLEVMLSDRNGDRVLANSDGTQLP